jgi:hypothetical protein
METFSRQHSLKSVVLVLFASSALFLSGCSDIIKFMASFQDKAKRPSPPATASGAIGTLKLTIDYGQPAKNGRDIFGATVPFGEVWRTGANEATEIALGADAFVAGKPLKAGRYQLFTIPRADSWTIIFNAKLGQWGAFFYDEDSNVLTVEAKPETLTETRERLTLRVESEPASGFSIEWDKTRVFVPVTAAAQ